MRRILAMLAAAVAGVVLIGGTSLGAPGTPGTDGGAGGNSGNGSQQGGPGAPGSPGGAPGPARNIVVHGPEIRVGPNARLGEDAHDLTLAARITCTNNATYSVQGKARQGETIGKGATTLQCEDGLTVVVTVPTNAPEAEFEVGQADGCVGLVRKGSNAKPTAACREVAVIS